MENSLLYYYGLNGNDPLKNEVDVENISKLLRTESNPS